MITFNVKIDENVTLKGDALRKAYERGAHLKIIGRSASNVVKDHFTALDRQRHRGTTSFHFYGKAARATSHGVQARTAFVSIDQEGIALRRRHPRVGHRLRCVRGDGQALPGLREKQATHLVLRAFLAQFRQGARAMPHGLVAARG